MGQSTNISLDSPSNFQTKLHRMKLFRFFDHISRKLDEKISPGYLFLDFYSLFWLFIVGSIAGLLIETIYHYFVFGGWESRAGLVWGPFSPIYGSGACILSVVLNRLYYFHNIIIFLSSMVIGSIIEYCTSWGMEYFWNAIAWDYSGTFGSINGRTNFFFGVMWGLLGLFWVRRMFPLIKWGFKHIDRKNKSFRVITILMTIFMLVNIDVTCLALNRQSERLADIPPHTQVDVWLDNTFPNEWLEKRFENMTVTAKKLPEKTN